MQMPPVCCFHEIRAHTPNIALRRDIKCDNLPERTRRDLIIRPFAFLVCPFFFVHIHGTWIGVRVLGPANAPCANITITHLVGGFICSMFACGMQHINDWDDKVN